MKPEEQQKPENMLQEQIDHIHKLIIRQDGAENILKLVTAEVMLIDRDELDEILGGG